MSDMRLEYVVDADVSGLDRMGRSVDRTTRQAERQFRQLDGTVSALSATFTAVASALATNKIIAYADAWITVNNKLANSVRAHEDLAQVTDRVFNIAQGSMAPLDATAALYQKLERSMRGTAYTMEDVTKVTSTINKALSVSGATASETESVITQLGQALGAGFLRGEEFNSVSENGTRILAALSDEMGVTVGALKAMAGQGELTTDVVFSALLNQSEKIGSEFEKMTRTMSKAFVEAENNITRFVGESTTVQKVVGEMGNGVVSLSQNLETVGQAATFAALAFGSKLVGGLALSSQEAIKKAVVNANLAKSELAAAQVVERRAIAEKQAAQVSVISAQERVAAARAAQAAEISTLQTQKAALTQTILNTKSESIRNTVRKQLTAVSTQLAAAQNGETATTARLTEATTALSVAKGRLATTTGAANAATVATAAAQTKASTTTRILTAATNGLKTAMGFLGGPVGIIMLAVSALYLFADASKNATDNAELLSRNLSTLSEKSLKLTAVELENSLKEALKKEKSIRNELKQVTAGFGANSDQVIYQNARLEKQLAIIQQIKNKQAEVIDQFVNMDTPAAPVKPKPPKEEGLSDKDAASLKKLTDSLNTEREAIQREYTERNAEILRLTKAGSDEQKDLLLRSGQERTQALKDLNESEKNHYTKFYRDKSQQAKEAARKARQLEMDQFNAKNNLLALSGQSELAQIKANEQQALTQIKDDLNKKLISYQQYEIAKKQIQDKAKQDELKNQLEKDKTTLGVDPYAQEGINYATKLQALEAYKNSEFAVEARYNDMKLQAQAEHEANIQALQEQTFRAASAGNEALMATLDSLSGTATNVFSGMLSGTMTATDAMKAFGNAILNEAIGSLVKMGIEQVKQLVMGKSMQAAATASAIAQGATIAAAMQPAAMAASIATSGGASVAGSAAYTTAMASSLIPISGALKNGGTTQAGKAYRVNEAGVEMWTSGTGQQFMLGGQRGKVTPANEVGGSGGSVNIVQNFTFDGGTPQDKQSMQQFAQMARAQTMQVLQEQSRQGGMLAR